ncbi:hypothetical protein PSHT_04506 [Puccinia striiformis]|uniref:Uncharacterized protein n=1 Tax=Puccinia striiformis TaxID=27350 RepID=A0A2S4WCT0_9BASI|nr:hypothetical protein PSHT_04506 [Puccinia striiformis]
MLVLDLSQQLLNLNHLQSVFENQQRPIKLMIALKILPGFSEHMLAQDPYKLIEPGRTYIDLKCLNVYLLLIDAKLAIIATHLNGVMQIFEYITTNIESQRGQKLLCRTGFNTSSEVSFPALILVQRAWYEEHYGELQLFLATTVIPHPRSDQLKSTATGPASAIEAYPKAMINSSMLVEVEGEIEDHMDDEVGGSAGDQGHVVDDGFEGGSLDFGDEVVIETGIGDNRTEAAPWSWNGVLPFQPRAEIQAAPVDLGGHPTLLHKATDNVFGRPRTGQQSMGISTHPLLVEDSSRPSRGEGFSRSHRRMDIRSGSLRSKTFSEAELVSSSNIPSAQRRTVNGRFTLILVKVRMDPHLAAWLSTLSEVL